jgi:ferredoxin
VDCFHEGENMLVIHPDECIDCGVCERMRRIGVLMSLAEGNSEGQSWVAGFVQRLDTLSAPMGSGAHRV